MVHVITLHLLLIGIYFLIVSQVAPFQEQLLSFMMAIGIILVFLAIIFRIILLVGMKIGKMRHGEQFNKHEFPESKNYYLSYFLIFLAFIFTLGGLMTMPSSP